MSSQPTRKRPLLAALLAFVYPGLGHVYLQAWLRALTWFGLSILMTMLVIPESVFAAFDSGGFTAMSEAVRAIGVVTFAPVLTVQFLNIADAYRTASRQGRQAVSEGATCPNCGRELDEELDFCPWCTTRLTESDEDATSR